MLTLATRTVQQAAKILVAAACVALFPCFVILQTPITIVRFLMKT